MGPFDALSNRTISAFPLSIGTSLAFESLFEGRLAPYDASREIPNQVNISGYAEIWINLATLVRNILGAVTKEDAVTASPEAVYSALLTEIDVIKSILEVEGKGTCKPIFYYCSYKTLMLHQRSKLVKFRQDKTALQKLNTHRLLKVMALLFKDNVQSNIVSLDTEIKPESLTKALILTHFPVDLLSYKHFRKLDLIESHTGRLKPRHLWYTKYYDVPGANMSILPFTRKLLLIFGDHVMISPMDIRFRRLILETAAARNWTSMTTDAKILMDLELDIKEKLVFDSFKEI